MSFESCPIAIVAAPAERLWTLLTNPSGWDDVFDLREIRANLPGSAAVGQTIYAKTGPWLFPLKVELCITDIDATNFRLGLRVKLPLRIHVNEEIKVAMLDAATCRVSYNCGFHLPSGWRGAVVGLLLRIKGRDAGPLDSLMRLKRAAEQSRALEVV
jgi:hypothetical protein